jgi:hypothetical protein
MVVFSAILQPEIHNGCSKECTYKCDGAFKSRLLSFISRMNVYRIRFYLEKGYCIDLLKAAVNCLDLLLTQQFSGHMKTPFHNIV